eukprot:COSAG05_NODE_640_length_8140_cov_15.055590_2_plen_133_part_00
MHATRIPRVKVEKPDLPQRYNLCIPRVPFEPMWFVVEPHLSQSRCLLIQQHFQRLQIEPTGTVVAAELHLKNLASPGRALPAVRVHPRCEVLVDTIGTSATTPRSTATSLLGWRAASSDRLSLPGILLPGPG